MTRFVLASSSPRRRQLLESIGLQFDVIPSAVPEELEPIPQFKATAKLGGFLEERFARKF